MKLKRLPTKPKDAETTKRESRRSALTKAYQEESEEEFDNDIESGKGKNVVFDKNTLIVSSGCTLLDLAISGNRIRGGGIPGGIMMELSGPPASGKTGLAVDIAASVQFKGGEAEFLDPEARMDQEYARIYGYELDKKNYSKPKTVTEVSENFNNWNPKNKKAINVKVCDSIAALCSELEMSDGGDKRGQAKAKELHSLCRKHAVLISDQNKLIVFTNHENDGEYGKTNPGGKAVPYYSSLRIRIAQKRILEPSKKLDLNGSGTKVEVKKAIGIEAECFVKKSSLDNPFQKVPLYLIFGKGIDDVRGNLQWYKDLVKSTKYLAVDKEYAQMNAAIKYIEDNDLEGELREMVIALWEKIADIFKVDNSKPKKRF